MQKAVPTGHSTSGGLPLILSEMDVDGDGKIADDAYNDSKGHFRKAAEIGKKLGLAWGGDWSSIVDKPHLYLPDWGSTPTPLIKQYKTPEKFMKTWIMEPVKWDGRRRMAAGDFI